jgi:hypothetical protein
VENWKVTIIVVQARVVRAGKAENKWTDFGKYLNNSNIET